MKHFSRRPAAALGLLLFLSGPALAGTVYSFVTEKQGVGLDDGTTTGRVLVDGEKFRIERAPSDDPQVSQLTVSKDGGEHEFAVDPQARTYFELEKSEAAITSPLFLLIPVFGGERIVKDVKVETVATTEPETVAGSTVLRRQITISYELTIKIPPPPPPPGRPPAKGPLETVRGKVKAEAVYWMAEDKAPLPGEVFTPKIRTGFPEVDGKLAGALAALRGLAVKQQVTVSTEGDSYMAARTSSVTTTIEGPKLHKTEAALFEVPSGFRMHKPEVTGPGLEFASPPG